jgi:hypothetical protein
MATKQVTVLWGSNFTNKLYLNSKVDGDFAFYAKSSGELMGGPEQDVLIADPTYSPPYDIRSKLQPRAFSIRVTINEGGPDPATPGSASRYGWLWHKRRHELLKALYSGLIRIVVDRYHPVQKRLMAVYLEGRVESAPEVEPGTFEIHLIAADPIFTEVSAARNPASGDMEFEREEADPAWELSPGSPEPEDWMTHFDEDSIGTGTPDETDEDDSYSGTNVTYIGSAPSEPVVTFEVTGNGRVWRYHKDFAVTNVSDVSLLNHPICLDLGQVLGVGGLLTGKAQNDLGDLRVETFGGARKAIYIRRHDGSGNADPGGNYAKVWFVMNSLQPGETKYLRLLYGNPYAEEEEETSSVKPMFSMYRSTNSAWYYFDFAPRYDQPQSRVAQWVPHMVGSQNITWLAHSHPDFGAPADPTLVAQGGAKATATGRASGYAGVELSCAVPIGSIQYDHRMRTNFKAPFVQRSRHQDGRWDDDYTDITASGFRRRSASTYPAGTTNITVAGSPPLADEGWASGLAGAVGLTLTNTTTGEKTLWDNSGTLQISSFPGAYIMQLSSAIPAGYRLDAGESVWQWPQGRGFGERTQSFTAGDEPRTVMLGMRADYPTLDIGEWFYAAAEYCVVNLLASDVPTVLWRKTQTEDPFTGTFSEGFEFDLDDITHGYQLIGRIQNDYDGTGLRVNYILAHLADRIVVDCKNRTAKYYEWDSVTGLYKEAQNVYSALYFEEVRDYWIQLAPGQPADSLRFVHDAQSNWRNLRVTFRWPNRYY